MWVDQAPYVHGFFTLTPHSLLPDDDSRISGHTGGALSGYLIAKIGINQGAASETATRSAKNGKKVTWPVPVFVLIDAIVSAELASQFGGGRYIFIDTTNEPRPILDALRGLGFKSITPTGSPVHFLKLKFHDRLN